MSLAVCYILSGQWKSVYFWCIHGRPDGARISRIDIKQTSISRLVLVVVDQMEIRDTIYWPCSRASRKNFRYCVHICSSLSPRRREWFRMPVRGKRSQPDNQKQGRNCVNSSERGVWVGSDGWIKITVKVAEWQVVDFSEDAEFDHESESHQCTVYWL